MDDRRADVRQLTCIPAHVDLGDADSPYLALIADLSVKGARLYTRQRLNVGDAVGLTLYMSMDGGNARSASGSVVRCVRRPNDRADVWHWELGVVFDAPITEYSDEVQELCERQRKVGILR
jgi:hypothetical protein